MYVEHVTMTGNKAISVWVWYSPDVVKLVMAGVILSALELKS